jgi:single-strand DNA-binding protein
MKLVAAFSGSLGKDCEVRNTKDGTPWLSFPAVVDSDRGPDEFPTWIRVSRFGDGVEALAPRLAKGVQVYCEGSLRLSEWTGRDGEKRTGLNMTATRVEILGEIGRRARP